MFHVRGHGILENSRPFVLPRKTEIRSLADGQFLAVRTFGLPQGRLEVRSDLIRNNQKKNWTIGLHSSKA